MIGKLVGIVLVSFSSWSMWGWMGVLFTLGLLLATGAITVTYKGK